MSFKTRITEHFGIETPIIMGGMTVTPQRNLRVNFADPYIVVGQTIVLRKDKAGEIKSFQDLNDPKYKIAVKLGTTGEHGVRITILNHAHGFANTMRTGRTRGDHRQIRAFQAIHDGHMTRNHVDDGAGNQKRRHTARTFIE